MSKNQTYLALLVFFFFLKITAGSKSFFPLGDKKKSKVSNFHLGLSSLKSLIMKPKLGS